jgi:hypothetical protein
MEQPLKMNLQFFADDNEDTETEETETTENENEENEQEETTFSQADVDREISKAVDKALKKREAKHQSELSDAVKKALDEEKQLSKLSEKERKDAEMTKREKDLADRENEIARKVMRSEAVDDLQEKSLPSEFADFLLGEDAEKTLENINTFKKTFDEAVNAAVKEKLRQDTPPAGGGSFKNGKSPSVADLAKEARLIK